MAEASNDAYFMQTNSEEPTMRTTLNIDDALIEKAASLTGIGERTALIHEGLRALIQRESARRLAKLGGTEAKLSAIPRRRVAEP
jgi:Arc/MetJ family transcription regulator